MDYQQLQENTAQLAQRFSEQRLERQQRRSLDAADFEALAEAGFLLVGVPEHDGGLWQDVPHSVRPICAALRTLAHGDSSVALVSAMHPAVLSYWLATPVLSEGDEAWQAQRREIFQGVRDGAWWGTITSEPGSGGDVGCTRAAAHRGEGRWQYFLSGAKHFGSGSGVMDFMVTTARPETEEEPDWFFVDVRNVAWDGKTGMKLVAEWDGHGMAATQSHAFSFERFPATRIAWPGNLRTVAARSGGLIGCMFTAVIVGIVEVAFATAGQRIDRDRLKAFEQIEFTRAEIEAWQIRQAYEGMLRAVEQQDDPRREVLLGKTSIAELSESVLRRLCKVVGGGTFSRRSPFGFWFEDVRALGFLRPPWGLAFDDLIHQLPAGEKE